MAWWWRVRRRCLRDKCIDRYVELNAHFHALIYNGSRAPRLVRLVRTLWVGVPPLIPIASPRRMRRSHAEHVAIVEKLAARTATARRRRSAGISAMPAAN
jgi:DNA-binding GntR family transcriptional regulator